MSDHASLVAEIARLREAARTAVRILTEKVEGEAWSPKIAKAVPILNDAIKGDSK